MSQVGGGDDAVGDPHRAQINSSFSSSNFLIRAFRAYFPNEIRQTTLCRAIRCNGISINGILPPMNIIMYDVSYYI